MEGESVGIYERDGSEVAIVQIQNDEIFENFKKKILNEIRLNLNEFDVMFVRKKPGQIVGKDSTTLNCNTFDTDLTLLDSNEPRRSFDYSADESNVSGPQNESSAVPNSKPNAESTVIVYPTVPQPRKVTQKRQSSEMAQDHDNIDQGEFTRVHLVMKFIKTNISNLQKTNQNHQQLNTSQRK